MKRFLLVILAICLLSACEAPDVEWEATYRIHYPDTTITYTRPFYGMEDGVVAGIGSIRGSNFVWVRYAYSNEKIIVSTTAPVELVECRKVKR